MKKTTAIRLLEAMPFVIGAIIGAIMAVGWVLFGIQILFLDDLSHHTPVIVSDVIIWLTLMIPCCFGGTMIANYCLEELRE